MWMKKYLPEAKEKFHGGGTFWVGPRRMRRSMMSTLFLGPVSFNTFPFMPTCHIEWMKAEVVDIGCMELAQHNIAEKHKALLQEESYRPFSSKLSWRKQTQWAWVFWPSSHLLSRETSCFLLTIYNQMMTRQFCGGSIQPNESVNFPGFSATFFTSYSTLGQSYLCYCFLSKSELLAFAIKNLKSYWLIVQSKPHFIRWPT